MTPTLAFSGVGAHATLTGSLSAPILLYARTGAENNYVYPIANVLGNVEAIDKFFYVEGAATDFAAIPDAVRRAAGEPHQRDG